MHTRTTIRNSIASLLNSVFDSAGTVKVGAEAVNVYSGYHAPLITTEMPGIILYFDDDKGSDKDNIYSTRKSKLAIEVYVKEVTDTDADIDYVCEHVESTLHLNREITGITELENIEYKGYERILDANSVPLPGQVVMNFVVQYNVTYNPAASTAVNFDTAHSTLMPNKDETTNMQVTLPR